MLQSDTNRGGTFGVVILAAGRSTRMGRPKLLMPWGQTSILGHLITQWRALSAGQIAVVFATEDHPLNAEMDRLDVLPEQRIPNPAPDLGMFHSIQCAARWPGWKPDLDYWLIVLGDQPHLRPETLRALLTFAINHPDQVCQPSQAGRWRHPVVLPGTVFDKLGSATVNTLNEFLEGFPRASCEMDDPGLALDIDRPEDYWQALALAGLSAART